jgi:glyoxylase-like metal-dependent hydrolase (beta-lactamase superfamily II)
MPTRKEQETPRPPETPEFAPVEVGGPPHDYPPQASLRVRKLAVGLYENNVFAIVSGDEAIIVDGADEATRILELVQGLKVIGIVQTHNHADHVQALPALVKALDVPVYAHAADPPPVPFTPLGDGDVLTVGTQTITAIHTPGHTPGSQCYSVDGHLFSGDTLFPGGPGKTSDAERFAEVMQSLDRLFAMFGDETRVCDGHGLDTTIGRERPYVDTWRARGW